MRTPTSSTPDAIARSGTALLLIAHGSRQEMANADLHHLVDQLNERAAYCCVVASFLELAEPSILKGGARCVERGAERVILLPYFLSAGVHVQRDLTKACQDLRDLYPKVHFCPAEPLGRHPLLVEVVLDRARAAENPDSVSSPG
ncbi:MAG TPA: CbiX/SirB N-terminal domain-containing protein [Gemmataceae bacterium]|nr:CbiX/SirB N-terminal domain-containing protein [Gemmataceae bacterium]